MFRNHKRIAMGVLVSTALALSSGCNGDSENYASKEKGFEVPANITQFHAAGSTFLGPLFLRWSSDYEKGHNMIVDYLPSGSGAGLSELKAKRLAFAATDAPLADGELKDYPPLIQVPVVAGPLCVAYNLEGLGEPIKLTGSTLAAIYAGQIKDWQDPAIAKENQGLKLPNTPITVVHRQDGSGTTTIFTNYLSAVSQSWSSSVGHGLTVPWPAGLGENGSDGVLNTVKKTPGAIGYFELNYAQEAHLPVASIQNQAGEFIAPTTNSAAMAIAAFDDALTKDPRTPIVDPPKTAKDAYPITGLSFILIPKDNATPGLQRQFKQFAAFCLTDGQNSVESMSYARLPTPILQQGIALLSQLTENGKPIS